MTLKSFLKGKREGTKVRIIYPTKIDDVEDDEKTYQHNIKQRPHLFDVVSWHLAMENYEPIIVINVK